MITGKLRNQTDRLWTEFWQGGITNPLTVIEQITYLMFMRLLDINETRNEKRASRTKKTFKGHFGPDHQQLRWKELLKESDPKALLATVRDEVFTHLQDIAGKESTFGRYMADAQFMIQNPNLLVKAMGQISELPLEKGDIKGDLYEYLLSKLNTAGISGQFRTPRHVIRMMVQLVDPQPDWTISDPACGTAGFLVAVREYLQEKYTSPDGVYEEERDGETFKIHTGDLLEPHREHIRTGMFHGYDFDVTMLRIAAMNMMLHDCDNPNIEYMDTLSNRFVEERPDEAEDHFDLVLANPPFKGSLDYETVDESLLRKVKTKKTELLFPALMLRMLKPGGRCAVIVPDGVLFGSSKAHLAMRKLLIEENQLEAVVKLPPGVFKPYTGVSTGILIFTKGGETTNVWFYDAQTDGFTLDDKRDKIGNADDFQDISDVPKQWTKWAEGRGTRYFKDRGAKVFFVPKTEIVDKEYDLSLNRYKVIQHEEAKYDTPHVIIERLRGLESEIATDLRELEAMLK